jgi:glucan 1,4-alpha-glucosidase
MRGSRRLAAALAAAGCALAAPAAALAAQAPGAPGATATWTTGAKQGVGTATARASTVWHTLAEGVLTEVYFPAVDVANVRDLELIVTDGRTFTDREREDTVHRVELADRRALLYRQVNTARSGRYRITKTYVTDTARPAVLVDVDFQSLDGGDYRVYVRHDPSIANTGGGDDGWVDGDALLAADGGIASALIASKPFRAASVGYAGAASDGWQDLRTDHRLDGDWDSAPDGNVVQVAELALGDGDRGSVTLALGFGGSAQAAARAAAGALARPFGQRSAAYADGWHDYLRSLDEADVPSGLRTQYRVALMTLRAHEDKLHRGGNIASLTIPWGQAVPAEDPNVGGYHLVWSRDLYQVATALIAAGDPGAAERALDYLLDVQQRPDGSFPQNTFLDGRPFFGSLQLDEVAFPILLAWQLGRFDEDTYRDHLKKAADFLVRRGPATPQERWEEEGGFSPSTIAAEIAGLVAAADLARRNGDDASATLYLGVADDWRRRLAGWTFTTTGPLGDGRYFERIDQAGDPNDGARIDINNGGGNFDEREIVDAGFLELVRLGVVAPDDPLVAASLPEVDDAIRVRTPHGPMWYRYNHDGYGEKADGRPYDGTGVGRLWPLLTGERGEYELANGRPADLHLRTMAGAANEGLMIPEQVWDRPDGTSFGFTFGEGTGSATPLAWSMAQFVRLAHSIDAGAPVERPSIVADRYAEGPRPAGPALAIEQPADGTTTEQRSILVTGTTSGERVVAHAAGETREAELAGGRFSVTVPLELGGNQVTVVAEGADGGTSLATVHVTSNGFGTLVGRVTDPAGDDDGPGDYVYPASADFAPGSFDLTELAVYEDGDQVRFVATIAGELRNPWGGAGIAVQRLNVYVRGGSGAGRVAALPGTNADLEAPYDRVVIGDGFDQAGVRDAGGQELARGSMLGVPAGRRFAVSVPRSAFEGIDLASARYAVAMLSHAAGDEGVGFVRPVYDRPYWESTAGTDMWWIRDYRFGGGAGTFDGSLPSRDTDTRDPNVIDVVVPEGADQASVLDWRSSSPVVLPYVALGG